MVPLGATYVPNTVKVADLLTEQGTAWDEEKIQEVFTPSDAQDVRQIVVGGPGREDYRAWNFTKNGIFTVRSAYHLGMAMKAARKALASSSCSVADHKSWLELWAADVPNKVKIHGWRLLKNGLAVGAELLRRRVKAGVFCIACGREETIIHRVWRCPHSQQFWKALSKGVASPLPLLPDHIVSVEGMRSWVLDWLGSASEEEKRVVLRAWYEMWLARNCARDREKIEDPVLIAERVICLDEEWQSIKESNTRPRVQRSMDPWTKPEEGWTKVNTDGALAKHGGSGGGGAVLRNHHGSFVAGACHFFPVAADPELVELLACRRGILLAHEINALKVVVEMDSMTAVGKINNQQKDLSTNGQVVQEIKELLTQFQEVKVCWVRRSANRVAHRLAREGCCQSLCKTWLHVAPECVSSDLAADGVVYSE